MQRQGSQNAREIPIDEYIEPAFHCEILHRVKVSRDTKLSRDYNYRTDGPLEAEESTSFVEGGEEADSYKVPEILLPSGKDEEICIGETLGPGQIWYVDGLIADWPEATPADQDPIRSKSEDSIQLPKQGNSIRRVFKWRKAAESGKQAEESQGEAPAGPPMRRGYTAGTHPDAMSAPDLPTHQPGKLKKIGTWTATKFKNFGGR
ncbi:hypothetical protein F5883DRAFT_21400 [Diaporthe sp. PMI_573]|nr:hypothetical protein F5883DRAFT_21400 [Diaporthaceae sp. PMI_573]